MRLLVGVQGEFYRTTKTSSTVSRQICAESCMVWRTYIPHNSVWKDMSYRVEVASSGRAGCQSTECKKEGIKIGKDELRLGTWVEIPDRSGSWRWRHWGCVTGKILQNIRNALDPNGCGKYSWEALDGYEGKDEKNSLEHYSDLQAKIRRVVTQGYIDPEDFKGDPEMNKLGSTGLRSGASKKKGTGNSTNSDELKKQLDVLNAERQTKLTKGVSTSKIDSQLKKLQKLLDEAEKLKAPQGKKQAPKNKSGKKRDRTNNKSDSEDFEDDEEKVEKPVKKKRVSAKDKKVVDQVVKPNKPEVKKVVRQTRKEK